MNIDQWFYQLNLAYEEKGIQISPEKEAFLLSEFPETTTYAQKQMIGEFLDVTTQFFYNKASHGEIFGNLSRIKERFGNSIEENYGISSGPFVDFANTYWTYKLEVEDLYPNFHTLVLSKILKEIEMDIASVFFPTPGPAEIPVSQRREKQRQLLEEFAPDIDVERFLSENPILRTKEERKRILKSLLSEKLERYCYDHIYELADAFNSVILFSRMEYEVGFNQVMYMLDVPEAERKNILLETKKIAAASGIPYNKLSPLNQFLKTVVPYVSNCLKTRPPDNLKADEINQLMNDEQFFKYLIKLGIKISQKVKGALWHPGIGWLGKVVLILVIAAIILLVLYFLL